MRVYVAVIPFILLTILMLLVKFIVRMVKHIELIIYRVGRKLVKWMEEE